MLGWGLAAASERCDPYTSLESLTITCGPGDKAGLDSAQNWSQTCMGILDLLLNR